MTDSLVERLRLEQCANPDDALEAASLIESQARELAEAQVWLDTATQTLAEKDALIERLRGALAAAKDKVGRRDQQLLGLYALVADRDALIERLRGALPDTQTPRLSADDVSLLTRLEAFAEPYANVDVLSMRAAMMEARGRLEDALTELSERQALTWGVTGKLLTTRQELRAALGRVEWQPIETAPKDGTPLLGFMPSYYQGKGGQSVILWLHGDWMDNRAFVTKPTHWMPLPKPPDAHLPEHGS